MSKTWEATHIALVIVACLGAIVLARREHDTNTPEAYVPYLRGVLACDPDVKIHWLTLAADADPNFAQVYRYRSLGYIEKNEHDRAIQDCTRAIQLKPDYPEAYNVRAITHYLKRDYDRAWADARMTKKLGGEILPEGFLTQLRQASGRSE